MHLRPSFVVFAGWLIVALAVSGCGASLGVQASARQPATAPTEALPSVEPTESLDALVPEPTIVPDPELDGPAASSALIPRLDGEMSAASAQVTSGMLSPKAEMRAERQALEVLPLPDQVNGQPVSSFVVMDQGVIDHMREIFALGQTLGRNARAFSKAGDSTIETPYFLSRFDSGPFQLGAYAHLKDVIKHYQGSYGRDSLAVRIGQHSWTLMNPAWADKSQCDPGEAPLACELRHNNPSILIIRLGANDAGVPKMFEKNMRAVIEYIVGQGVIPVLSTKPDQRQGTEQVNDIVRRLAAEYKVPLWDFERVAETLPGRGLGPDGVHMTGFYQNDYTLPQAFQRGHGVQNLTALIVLDKIWQELSAP